MCDEVASSAQRLGIVQAFASECRFREDFLLATSPSRVSRATRCYVQIYAALALAPVIILLTISGSVAAEKQLISQSMAGTVKDALGRPVIDAAVTLRAADGRTVLRTTSNAHGQFKLPRKVVQIEHLLITNQDQ